MTRANLIQVAQGQVAQGDVIGIVVFCIHGLMN